MKRLIQLGCILLVSLSLVSFSFAHSYDLNQQKVTSLEDILADLQQVQVIFVGEIHDQRGHHQAQLQIIQELHDAGVDLSIGLEMFRQDGQSDLDNWVEGLIDDADFSAIFSQHWGWWHMYRDIFIYARDNRIPLVGLNISREIVNQVAREGFDSLSSEQRKKLPLASCNVSPEYQDFIRRALGQHGDHGTAFENFCAAQMLWDASMAKNLEGYLRVEPGKAVVVLAGNGHSWKHGIPEQLIRRGAYVSRVLLPEVPGRIDLNIIDADDADYLLQGVDQAPLH